MVYMYADGVHGNVAGPQDMIGPRPNKIRIYLLGRLEPCGPCRAAAASPLATRQSYRQQKMITDKILTNINFVILYPYAKICTYTCTHNPLRVENYTRSIDIRILTGTPVYP